MTEMDQRSVFQQALELADLEFDWDTYGNEPPIEQPAINAACEFLVEHFDEVSRKAASVVPTSGGGIQVEWHQNGADLEIEWDGKGDMIGLLRTGALKGLSELDYETPETTPSIIASWAVTAASEWPPAIA